MRESKNYSICIDANVIVWSLVPAPLSDAATRVVEKHRQNELSLVAPALLAFEVTASLRRLVFLEEITPDQGEEAFQDFLKIDVDLSQRTDIFPLAWKFAKQFNRPRAYDTVYLALSRLRDCEFWTADKRLYNAVRGELEWVKWIGDAE